MAIHTELPSYIDAATESFGKVGCAIVGVDQAGVAYEHVSGRRRIDDCAAIDLDTLFQVGSTTKAFTATAIGVLVDEGRVSFDDPIARLVPDFRLKDGWLEKHITIRDVLAHRTGLGGSPSPFIGLMDSAAMLAQFANAESVESFRDSFVYHNTAYQLCARVIEEVSGKSWGAFLQERIFHPLGMTRSLTSPYECWPAQFVASAIFGTAPAGLPKECDALQSNVAMPHVVGDDGRAETFAWQSYDYAAAAGAIVSSARDMGRWVQFNLGGGTEKLIKPETLDEIQRVQNLHPGDGIAAIGGVAESYALGWWRGAYRGAVHIMHGGGIVGFPTYVAFLPEKKTGIVVLCNGPKIRNSSYQAEMLYHQAITCRYFDRSLDLEPIDRIVEFRSKQSAFQTLTIEEGVRLTAGRETPTGYAAASTPDYAGDYVSNCGNTRVMIHKKELEFSLLVDGVGGYAAVLEPWSAGIYRLVTGPGVRDCLPNQFVEFRRGPDGKVAALEMMGVRFERSNEVRP